MARHFESAHPRATGPNGFGHRNRRGTVDGRRRDTETTIGSRRLRGLHRGPQRRAFRDLRLDVLLPMDVRRHPSHLFLEFPALMRKSPQSVGLAGKEREAYVRAPLVLECAVPLPPLMRGNRTIFRAEKNQRRHDDVGRFEQRRFADVGVQIPPRNVADVIGVEGDAELAGSDVGNPVHVAGARHAGGDLEVVARCEGGPQRRHRDRKNGPVRPTADGDLLRIDRLSLRHVDDPFREIDQLEFEIALADRFGERETVVARTVIVDAQDVGALLRVEMRGVTPRVVPFIAIRGVRSAVGEDVERVLLSFAMPQRVVEQGFDDVAARAFERDDFRLRFRKRRIGALRDVETSLRLQRTAFESHDGETAGIGSRRPPHDERRRAGPPPHLRDACDALAFERRRGPRRPLRLEATPSRTHAVRGAGDESITDRNHARIGESTRVIMDDVAPRSRGRVDDGGDDDPGARLSVDRPAVAEREQACAVLRKGERAGARLAVGEQRTFRSGREIHQHHFGRRRVVDFVTGRRMPHHHRPLADAVGDEGSDGERRVAETTHGFRVEIDDEKRFRTLAPFDGVFDGDRRVLSFLATPLRRRRVLACRDEEFRGPDPCVVGHAFGELRRGGRFTAAHRKKMDLRLRRFVLSRVATLSGGLPMAGREERHVFAVRRETRSRRVVVTPQQRARRPVAKMHHRESRGLLVLRGFGNDVQEHRTLSIRRDGESPGVFGQDHVVDRPRRRGRLGENDTRGQQHAGGEDPMHGGILPARSAQARLR